MSYFVNVIVMFLVDDNPLLCSHSESFWSLDPEYLFSELSPEVFLLFLFLSFDYFDLFPIVIYMQQASNK